jgi:hypothetical protein
MRIEQVEIYSDQTNNPVMCQPGRRFPGVFIQGDMLHTLCQQIDTVCAEALPPGESDAFYALIDVRDALQGFLAHYRSVLHQHDIALPFVDSPAKLIDQEVPDGWSRDAVKQADTRTGDQGINLAEAIRRRFAPFGGIDLPEHPRVGADEPPSVDP